MKLPKLLSNDLIEAIRAAGLDPRDFRYLDGEDEDRIEHKSSGSYFVMRKDGGRYGLSY